MIVPVRQRAPPGQPHRQPARMPVIERRERPVVAARHRPQQRRVVALLGLRPHALTVAASALLGSHAAVSR